MRCICSNVPSVIAVFQRLTSATAKMTVTTGSTNKTAVSKIRFIIIIIIIIIIIFSLFKSSQNARPTLYDTRLSRRTENNARPRLPRRTAIIGVSPSVCLFAYLRNHTAEDQFCASCMTVTVARSFCVQRRNTLCTSGSVDDVIFYVIGCIARSYVLTD